MTNVEIRRMNDHEVIDTQASVRRKAGWLLDGRKLLESRAFWRRKVGNFFCANPALMNVANNHPAHAGRSPTKSAAFVFNSHSFASLDDSNQTRYSCGVNMTVFHCFLDPTDHSIHQLGRMLTCGTCRVVYACFRFSA